MSDMPESMKDLFSELKNEILWLHARWKIYRQLFAHSARRIDLLNQSARVFFIIVHTTLLDEIQISFGKITDPALTGKHENLSLDQLQERVEVLVTMIFLEDFVRCLMGFMTNVESFAFIATNASPTSTLAPH